MTWSSIEQLPDEDLINVVRNVDVATILKFRTVRPHSLVACTLRTNMMQDIQEDLYALSREANMGKSVSARDFRREPPRCALLEEH